MFKNIFFHYYYYRLLLLYYFFKKMFDYVKNTVHKVSMGVTKMIVAPPKET